MKSPLRKSRNSSQTKLTLTEPQSWNEIFVPSGFPKYNFVDRKTYSNQVDTFLRKPGHRIMAVAGLSRTGKTNLLIDTIQKAGVTAHWLNGASIKTFKDFSNMLLQELDLYDRVIQLGIGGEGEFLPNILNWIIGKFKISGNHTTTYNDPVDEINIVKAMTGKVVIVDDFHRVPRSVQRDVLAFVKGLSELPDKHPEAKIDFRFIFVFIPSLDTMDFTLAAELRGRAKWLEIPLWQPEELIRIAEKRLIDADRVVLGLKKLAVESYGLPSMMQLFCLTYCNQHLAYELPNIIGNIRDDQLPSVFSSTGDEVWGPSGDSVYRELVALNGRSHPDRDVKLNSKIDSRCGDIYMMIWYAIAGPSIPLNVREELPKFKMDKRLEISVEAITKRLEKLTDIETGKTDYIRRCIRLMSDEAKLSYASLIEKTVHPIDPLFEYRDESDALVIYDPAIIVSLAHSTYYTQKFRFPNAT